MSTGGNGKSSAAGHGTDWMNVLVSAVVSVAKSYVDTMSELATNTLDELSPSHLNWTAVEFVHKHTPALKSHLLHLVTGSGFGQLLMTAFSNLFGLSVSFLVIYAFSKFMLWICCGRSTKIESVQLYGGSPLRERSQGAVEVSRWFNQAWLDLLAARNDFDCVSSAPEWVCYKCQQAMEKALKAMLLSQSATNHNNVPQASIMTHDICQLASATNKQQFIDAASKLHAIVGRSPRMRYPDFLPYPKIPRDVYSLSDAVTVHALTQTVLQEIRRQIGIPVIDND